MSSPCRQPYVSKKLKEFVRQMLRVESEIKLIIKGFWGIRPFGISVA